MRKRRQFIKLILGFFAGLGLLFSPLAVGIRWVWAKAQKIILPKGTQVKTLIGKNPANLDTRNLELTPTEKFGTMGLASHQVDLNKWQLEINGRVQRPIKLRYSQVTEIPSVKKDVLLICPGVFAYHARWEGVSVAKLLEKAQASSEATHVSFSGPEGWNEKTERFPIEDIRSDRVFLAYNVNNNALPEKHGFPLRAVAEGYYGSQWVKYVYKVTVHKS
jgi:DMSO/TMAO reductase YedYZ molybdopterin-dependent catalytic subunit